MKEQRLCLLRFQECSGSDTVGGTLFDALQWMRRCHARIVATAITALLLVAPARAGAYSVLAHEAIVDSVWAQDIEPMLRRRFPGAATTALQDARAYAYGGSLIQDLGYYPFGSRFFSNLVHYVRSGDFVEAMILGARNVNEYAFALGALAHYTSDNLGHPIAVNRAVPIIYPKLHERHGAEVLYADSPARHVMVEFAFDVLQVARGAFKADQYQNLVGFEVATSLLERAFRDTYGLELEDVFGDVDLAIGTYRRAASRIIPDITRLAWQEKRDEILAAMPDVTERTFVYTMTRRQYEEAFGTKYRKPGILARLVVVLFKIVPKFGPFKPLAFEPLTPETERLFLQSFAASRSRYQVSLAALRSRRLTLSDTDLDTGRQPLRGANPLADKTYAELLKKLARNEFVGTPPSLRRAVNAHFASTAEPRRASQGQRTESKKTARHLAALNAAAAARR